MSIYRNIICNSCRHTFRCRSTKGRHHGFRSVGTVGAWRARLQAFFDREVLPRHRAWLEHTDESRSAALHGRTAAQGAGGGIVESRPSRTCARRARDAAFKSRIRAARRDHGAAVLGSGSFQLPGARRSQHDRAAELRRARAEAALAAAAAGSRNPFGVRHDRAGCGLLGRDQYRHPDRARQG